MPTCLLLKVKYFYYYYIVLYNIILYIGLVGTVFANDPGRPAINLRSRHTKDFKNGT